MIQTRRGALENRVERIERAIAEPPQVDQPLSRHELRELRELEQARQARFPGEIDQWDAAMLADFTVYSAGAGGMAQRLDHLRRRSHGREQTASDLALEMAIGSMDRDQLDAFMEAMASCSPEPARGDRP